MAARQSSLQGARKFVAGRESRCKASLWAASAPFPDSPGHSVASYWCSLAVLMVFDRQKTFGSGFAARKQEGHSS